MEARGEPWMMCRVLWELRGRSVEEEEAMVRLDVFDAA
jgi:hypothetical protein